MFVGKVKWLKGFEFDGWDGEGREIKFDASVKGGGEGKGYRPAELPIVALAACAGMNVIEILQKMRQEVLAFEVNAEARPIKDTPSGYDGIHIEYVITGKNIDRGKAEKAAKLSEEKYCTLGNVLSKATTITHEIKIIDE
jgi:putative redox protein